MLNESGVICANSFDITGVGFLENYMIIFGKTIEYINKQISNILDLPLGDNKYSSGKVTTEITETNVDYLNSIAAFLDSFGENSISKKLRASNKATNAFSFKEQIPKWNLEVEPTEIIKKDFCSVQHFKSLSKKPNPSKVLLVPPLSGHFSTLLRGTVKGLIDENDTDVIEWKNAKDVEKNIRFGTEQFIEYLIDIFQELGEDGLNNVFAVCQPCPLVLAAAAYCEQNGLITPKRITLMAGPVDISKNKTAVNKYAEKITIADLEKKVIHKVSDENAIGYGREVYPGFIQILSFIAMNDETHKEKFKKLVSDILSGNDVGANKTIDFYDDYMSGLDMPKEFFLETIDRIFHKNEIASGVVEYKGEKIYLSSYTGKIFTLEGENDDICGIGQTEAALNLVGSPEYNKFHHVISKVGHYGTFDSKTYRESTIHKLNAFFAGIENEEFLYKAA